jgi:hypothetical protein
MLVLEIIGGVLLPILLLIGLGVLLGRGKRLDLGTLAKLNLYLFAPAFLLVRVAESRFAWREIGLIGAGLMVPMALVGLPALALLRARKRPNAIAMPLLAGALLSNAGNFGIPVAQLAFGHAGSEVQALVVVFMNTTIFFIGYLLLSGGEGGFGRALGGYLKLPMLYVILVGAGVRLLGGPTALPLAGRWLWKTVQLTADATAPIALVSLGAQIAANPPRSSARRIVPVLGLKLLALPAVTSAVCWALGLWPWPAAQLVLAAAAPTAINTVLLAVEVKADAEVVADTVFWTSLLAPLTMAPVLSALKLLGAGALPVP